MNDFAESLVTGGRALSTFRFSVLRMTVQDRPCWSTEPAQDVVVDGDGRRYTNVNETRNETNRSPVACGERQVQTT
jgi:hypothetical protein